MDTNRSDKPWIFHLYVVGMTLAAKRALLNITAICEEHLAGTYSLDVIDLIDNPALAEGEQIFAVPTLVRQLPRPLRKVIGDLSEPSKVLAALDLEAHALV
jgi:circadian clock protein KaiB